MRLACIPFLILFVTGLCGCGQGANQGGQNWTDPVEIATGDVKFPELGASRPIQPGVLFQEATLQRDGVPMRVWVYLPEHAGKDKLPLVVVPPAGSTLFVGMNLSDGDRAEHYPYARAGFAVVSFEIDGHVANLENAADSAIIKGARQFMASKAGLANAKTALEFTLAKVPNIDAARIYTAGHSSAATLALLFASFEPRVKGCAAYAPATDVVDRLRPATDDLSRSIPGIRDFVRFSSPLTHVDKLKCPVFLFHARDDNNVPFQQSASFAEQLKKTNSNVTLVAANRGGHYQPMIDEGIPKAIAWMKGAAK